MLSYKLLHIVKKKKKPQHSDAIFKEMHQSKLREICSHDINTTCTCIGHPLFIILSFKQTSAYYIISTHI